MNHLYKHQQDIINADPKKCGIFTSTGTGKTRICLLLAKGETLVICPKTQRDDRNWEREYLKIVDEQASRYGRGQPIKVFKPKLTVMSKEEFRRDAASLPRFETVIVDEAHTCLGVTPGTRQRHRQVIPMASQLFEALDVFIQRTKPERLYLCTATIIKSPFTVWAAAKLLGKIEGDTMGSFYRFRETYYQRLPMPGRDVYSPKSTREVKDKLARLVKDLGYIGRLEDFIDMPEQVFKTEYVELTPKQKDRIKDIALEFPDPLVGALKKHMIENGILSGDEFNLGEEFPNKKLERILDYSIEFPQLLVFARYRAQIAQLAKALEKDGKKVFVLTGDTKDRGGMLAKAKATNEYVFIAQSQVSSGWELPDCPTVIFASLDFSLVNLVQAQGRVSRINNPKRNLYIYLVARGVDEHVYNNVVKFKMDFHLAVYAQN